MEVGGLGPDRRCGKGGFEEIELFVLGYAGPPLLKLRKKGSLYSILYFGQIRSSKLGLVYKVLL